MDKKQKNLDEFRLFLQQERKARKRGIFWSHALDKGSSAICASASAYCLNIAFQKAVSGEYAEAGVLISLTTITGLLSAREFPLHISHKAQAIVIGASTIAAAGATTLFLTAASPNPKGTIATAIATILGGKLTISEWKRFRKEQQPVNDSKPSLTK
jgi:hypothetical protein